MTKGDTSNAAGSAVHMLSGVQRVWAQSLFAQEYILWATTICSIYFIEVTSCTSKYVNHISGESLMIT